MDLPYICNWPQFIWFFKLTVDRMKICTLARSHLFLSFCSQFFILDLQYSEQFESNSFRISAKWCWIWYWLQIFTMILWSIKENELYEKENTLQRSRLQEHTLRPFPFQNWWWALLNDFVVVLAILLKICFHLLLRLLSFQTVCSSVQVHVVHTFCTWIVQHLYKHHQLESLWSLQIQTIKPSLEPCNCVDWFIQHWMYIFA